MGRLFRFRFMRGVPVHQACRNFFPLRALDAPVPHAVAFHRVLARQLDRFRPSGSVSLPLGRAAGIWSRPSRGFGVRVLLRGEGYPDKRAWDGWPYSERGREENCELRRELHDGRGSPAS